MFIWNLTFTHAVHLLTAQSVTSLQVFCWHHRQSPHILMSLPVILCLAAGFSNPWYSVDLHFLVYLGELSLTLLSLKCGWVNPFLSRAHAAPVHHCFTQNTRVQLCSRARQQGERRQEHGLCKHAQTHTRQPSGFGVSPVSITALSVTW